MSENKICSCCGRGIKEIENPYILFRQNDFSIPNFPKLFKKVYLCESCYRVAQVCVQEKNSIIITQRNKDYLERMFGKECKCDTCYERKTNE